MQRCRSIVETGITLLWRARSFRDVVVIRFFGVPFLFLTICPHGTAETIKLKNGSVVQGSIVEMNETDVVVDTADMGQVRLKRRAVESITDGPGVAGSGGEAKPTSPVNININNSQQNDQKVVQKNEQRVEQHVEQNVEGGERPEKKAKEREWAQGFYGRLAAGGGSFTATPPKGDWPSSGATKEVGGTGIGAVWDLLGFRSASWWSASLIGAGGNESEDAYSRDFTFVGARFDANFLRQRLGGDALSQLSLGGAIGSASMTFEKNSEDLAEFSGGGYAAFAGYDYLGWRHLGFTAQAFYWSAQLTEAELDNAAAADGVSDFTKDGAIRASGAGLTAGIYWNVDL